MNYKIWISAMRLRTLPLSLSSLFIGAALSYKDNTFDFFTFLLIILTAIGLQITSNFANDYGDAVHGADNKLREGPSRKVQKGLISKKEMRKAIFLSSFFSILIGFFLVFNTFPIHQWQFSIMIILGFISLGAGIYYTMGRYPFGYIAMGDIAVFLFFGWVAVLGTYFLMRKELPLYLLFPAWVAGFFCTAVLNINNIRDIKSDKIVNKKTIANYLGAFWASIYHFILIFTALVILLLYAIFHFSDPIEYLFCFCYPFFIYNIYGVYSNRNKPKSLDKYLGHLSLSYLFLSLLFFMGQLF